MGSGRKQTKAVPVSLHKVQHNNNYPLQRRLVPLQGILGHSPATQQPNIHTFSVPPCLFNSTHRLADSAHASNTHGAAIQLTAGIHTPLAGLEQQQLQTQHPQTGTTFAVWTDSQDSPASWAPT